MNFPELKIARSYISQGEKNISNSFLVPALKSTKAYYRSVGFFSSSVLTTILEGVMTLASNGGSIKLISSPKLSEEDIEAINSGYKKRDQTITDHFQKEFQKELETIDDVNLQFLEELIAKNILDIKIAVTKSLGFYHDKLGVMEDFTGNRLAFFGSSNSTLNGYQNNYEKIRVSRSWMEGEAASVEDEYQEFISLWEGRNEFVDVYSFQEGARKSILETIAQRKEVSSNTEPIVLRDYQEEAIRAWVNNDYHGFFVMATGTGKTWTAIYAAKRLLEKEKAMIVIIAPYKHLVKQWTEDLEKVFVDSNIIMASSENPTWQQQISQEIISKRYQPSKQIVIVSTIATFGKERFQKTLDKSTEKKLLIVDEAHRFTDRREVIQEKFQYMLGLSATPYSGKNAQAGQELMEFFGGQVFNLPIEVAIERGFLVNYYYHPIYVNATAEEENLFNHFTQKIISCFRHNVCINPELLIKSLRGRLRVIAMSEEKREYIDKIIDSVAEKDHLVVYCGDGKLFDDDGRELRHIQAVKRALSPHGYKCSQFTAREKMTERMALVDSFNKGQIDALVAIRCLDEGINIPSITGALILASNDDYREFVQRRGRILRCFKGKKFANIYDVIVLPETDMEAWAKIEFRRFHEYARLALNSEELENDLQLLLCRYGLEMEDINVFDYDEMEAGLDE